MDAQTSPAVEPPRLTVPQGTFVLGLHPARPGVTLRAWDAADEYALQHVADTPHVGPTPGRCLVVGDRAGALAVALAAAGWDVTSMSDSVLAHMALDKNLGANDITAPVHRVDSLAEDLSGPFALVVVKVPKSLAMLEDQLRRVRRVIDADTVVLGAGMTRRIHNSTIELFQTVLGPTTTSLARKKARLLHCSPDPSVDPGPSPFPTTYALGDATVVSHAAVFSQGRLDDGTAVLLANLPAATGMRDVVDLGCGDGVVGLRLAQSDPDVRVTFVDESHMALDSARQTMEANLPGRQDRYLLGDGMAPIEDASVDLVVVNPPFHDDHAMGDAIAWDMFTGARRALRPGGRLVVVGNRHLAYHAKLARLFGGSTTIASDRRFVVLGATRKAPRG